jgi:hypothetical protein
VNNVPTKHGLNACVLAYVKDERGSFSTITFALTYIVLCEVFGLSTPFVWTCCCPRVTNMLQIEWLQDMA